MGADSEEKEIKLYRAFHFKIDLPDGRFVKGHQFKLPVSPSQACQPSEEVLKVLLRELAIGRWTYYLLETLAWSILSKGPLPSTRSLSTCTKEN